MRGISQEGQFPKEPYTRTRENPYFNGLLKGDDRARIFNFHHQGSLGDRNISRSTSDIGGRKLISNMSGKDMGSASPLEDSLLSDNNILEPFDFDFGGIFGSQTGSISRSTSDIDVTRNTKIDTKISGKVKDSTLEDSFSDIIFEPFDNDQKPSSGRWSKIVKTTSFAFPSSQSGLSYDLKGAQNHAVHGPNLTVSTFEENDKYHTTSHDMGRPVFEKSYSMAKRKPSLARIPLPQSAATFYNGNSPAEVEIVESCESINRLNMYLRARKDDVKAGVPGKFLHAVIGQDISDVGLVASTIMYAFYLNETSKSNQLCTVPVINMKRADLSSHAEIKWLIESCQIDQSSLIFVDEIDLSYYDLFGSLKVVLLNSQKLPNKQEALQEAVVEIFCCRKGESTAYPWVETVTVGEDCSCCTLIAEKFALASPEILAGQGFSRLLISTWLLLINGAGRFGCNGFYQILKYKMYDVSDLKIVDILHKDFKKWRRSLGKPDAAGSRSMALYVGMSSIGISIAELLAHEYTSSQEIKNFQKTEKLRLLMIVSGYYDAQKNFKKLCKGTVVGLSVTEMVTSSITVVIGLRDEMKAFKVDQVTSRKTIERLLEEFGGASKG
ncbi:exopolyphosphatase PRUNE1-like [Fagus crenata]